MGKISISDKHTWDVAFIHPNDMQKQVTVRGIEATNFINAVWGARASHPELNTWVVARIEGHIQYVDIYE